MSDFSIKREENQILYSRDTLKRLASDIKCIKKNPLNDQGIYYEHDQENILKGYALIIGPPDTPYEYGHYFFDFDLFHEIQINFKINFIFIIVFF